MARPVTVGNFLTELVTSLNWDYHAHISSIVNDQWSGVTVEMDDGSERLHVECDQAEHGLAAVWKTFADARLVKDPVPDS